MSLGTVNYEYNDSHEKDVVLHQSPSSGSIQAGDKINLVVSNGPKPVETPKEPETPKQPETPKEPEKPIVPDKDETNQGNNGNGEQTENGSGSGNGGQLENGSGSTSGSGQHGSGQGSNNSGQHGNNGNGETTTPETGDATVQ